MLLTICRGVVKVVLLVIVCSAVVTMLTLLVRLFAVVGELDWVSQHHWAAGSAGWQEILLTYY